MSVTGDVDFAENKKRHTRTVEEKLHDLHISQAEQDSEPEPKKLRSSPEENVNELPVHKCGLDKRQFVDVSVVNTLSFPLVLFILQFVHLNNPCCFIYSI